MFSEILIKQLMTERQEHHDDRSSILPMLQLIQKHHRYVSDEDVGDLASLTNLSETQIDELATFYNHIYRQPMGRHVILLCDSMVCHCKGAQKIFDYIKDDLNLPLGKSIYNDSLTLLPNICLGLCDHAPAALYDGQEIQKLTVEDLNQLIEVSQNE